MMDLDAIRGTLADHFPQWSSRIDRMEIIEDPTVRPVANDGSRILVNSRVMQYYTEEAQTFYLAQQLMHLQFAHEARGRGKERLAWKLATDSVVNHLLRDDGFQVPMDAVLFTNSEGMSAETLYDVVLAGLLDQKEKELPIQENEEENRQKQEQKAKNAGKTSQGGKREIDDPGLAMAVSGLAEMLQPSLQLDFDWFPGSTIRDGMLPYEFKSYPVAHAEILLDTSASVDPDLLRSFVKSVKGLMKEDAVVRVGCFDTRFYGFHEIHSEQDIDSLELRGAGGTNFNAAVAAFTGDAENQIIFTDGYAEMPEQRCDAVWVVYGNMPISPKGGRVIYSKPAEEKEKHEIDFLIT